MVNLSTYLNLSSTEIGINPQINTTYTTVITDRNTLVTMSNTSAIALTIPTDDIVNHTKGTTIAFQQLGTGTVTMGGTGITFNSRYGLISAGQYAVWSITKTQVANTWSVAGDLVA